MRSAVLWNTSPSTRGALNLCFRVKGYDSLPSAARCRPALPFAFSRRRARARVAVWCFCPVVTTTTTTTTGASTGVSAQARAMQAPNALQRKACWAARDELWRCLDERSDEAAPCEAARKVFEARCPAQWVKYFNKRRDFLKFKEKMDSDGFQPSS